ncbi:hypothetical protein MKQ70_07010 [Chitinophaga sedimenti]|uniref:hypothetical protein n=1 Tax=Chitinophaga sedimenti TaxID=2033606 RepID=UPI00200498EC|nr:hypothetical protein [Chitinophaga sedimenti]MCK7554763.1 hypothetical protein [Chitinophaga sedimenti]
MKKILYALAALTLVASCSKSFLERDPINKRTTESFYKTPKDALEALVAVYDVLQIGGYDNIQLVSEIASDNCFGGGGESDMAWKRWDRFENDINTNDGPWTKYYQGHLPRQRAARKYRPRELGYGQLQQNPLHRGSPFPPRLLLL